MKEMKVIKYREGQIKMETVSAPQCKENEVLIEVKSCLLDQETNPGNYIGGRDFGGVVRECGSAISEIKPGDRVVVDSAVPCGKCYACRKGEQYHCEHTVSYGKDMPGGYAQLVAADERSVYKISDGLTFDEAVFARRVAKMYAAFSKIENKSGYSMLIVGSGADAKIALQMAQKSSAGRVAACGDDRSFEDIKDKAGAADVVVNLSRDNDLTYRLLDLVIPGGSMLMLGKSKGKKTLDFQDARDFFFHIANIITSNPKAGFFIDGLNYIEEKLINVSDLIDERITYNKIDENARYNDERIVVLHPND